MFKTIKPLFLLLVVALTASRALSPMNSNSTRAIEPLDPKQPPTGITIEAIPHDCLCEILRACPKVAELRLVSKNFKTVIDNYPCYFTRINGQPYFLRYQLTHKPSLYLFVFLHDKKSAKNFVNAPFLPIVKKESFFVYMNLPKEGLVTFFKPYLKNLTSCLGKLTLLKIQFSNTFSFIRAHNCTSLGTENIIFQKKTIHDEELSMFGEVTKLLEINNGHNLVSEPPAKLNLFGKIKKLLNSFNICNSHTLIDQAVKKPTTEYLIMRESNHKFLKHFPNLRTLEINRMNSFKSTMLNRLVFNFLEQLNVIYCKKFKTDGLEELKNLYRLGIDDFGAFISTHPKQLKNIKELVLYSSPTPFKKTFGKEAEKKVSTILKTVGKQKNLQKFTVYGNYAALGETGSIKALKNLTLNGCTINMPTPISTNEQPPLHFD